MVLSLNRRDRRVCEGDINNKYAYFSEIVPILVDMADNGSIIVEG